MKSDSPSRPRIYPMLDVFRVVAVSMVIILHTPSVSRRMPVLRAFAPSFWLGVELFMLISGWLLGGMLIREAGRMGRLDRKRFYIRRWLRTLPSYFAVLIVLLLITFAWRGNPPGLNGAWFSRSDGFWVWGAHFLFLQEYLDVERFAVSWSLCVEEHFYLILPWLVPLLLRWRGKRAIMLLLALATMPTLLRMSFPTAEAPTITHLRCEGLFVGVMLAMLAHQKGRVWTYVGKHAPLLFFGGIFATLSLLLFLNVFPVYLQPALGTLTMAPMVAAAVHDASSISSWSIPKGRYLGELTYSVYLTHSFVPAISIPWAPTRLVQLVALVVLPVLLHNIVERPFLALRDQMRRQPPANRVAMAEYTAPPASPAGPQG